MKKGDMKKQEIIRTAEIRFCRDGYEKTSIQDIIDDLHTSKGSFYHHFVSKEALLEEICRNRVQNTKEEVMLCLKKSIDAKEKMNVLINGMIPFSGERINFLLMLIPVFSGPEGEIIRNCYANEIDNCYHETVAETLKEGTINGLYACYDSDFFADILIMIINRFWFEICNRILENEENRKRTDPSDLMMLTEYYRKAAERLLCAPYGSISLMDFCDLKNIIEQIQLHWKL